MFCRLMSLRTECAGCPNNTICSGIQPNQEAKFKAILQPRHEETVVLKGIEFQFVF